MHVICEYKDYDDAREKKKKLRLGTNSVSLSPSQFGRVTWFKKWGYRPSPIGLGRSCMLDLVESHDLSLGPIGTDSFRVGSESTRTWVIFWTMWWWWLKLIAFIPFPTSNAFILQSKKNLKRRKIDAEIILEFDFEVTEAYLEWIEHFKKVHKCQVKNWREIRAHTVHILA